MTHFVTLILTFTIISAGVVVAELFDLQTAILFAGIAALVMTIRSIVETRRGEGKTLRAIDEGLRRIAKGDLDTRMTATLGDKNPSATAFDKMTSELKRTQVELAKSERMAAWRDIARRIAHEVKNPLLPIRVSMETLQKAHERQVGEFDEILTESTQAVLEETRRLERLVGDFSNFANMPLPNKQDIDLVDVATHVASLYSGVAISVQQDELLVRADRDQITQLLINLVKNATEAAIAANAAGDAKVVVDLAADANATTLSIEDNGPGVAAAQRHKIFEPYHTTKSEGTGLGLAIAHRIATDHGGELVVEEGSLGGARFVLTLPTSRL